MSIKILVFDYRVTEHKFFEKNNFNNYDIKFFDFSLNEETVNQIPEEDKENASIISVFVNSVVTKEVINCFKNLRAVAARSTGIDNINKRACVQRNIAVLNVQNYGETSVAEFTIGFMIALVRKIPQAFMSVKNENYYGKSFVGRDLERLTLGVVGTGAIGASVCKLAHTLGMKILAYDLVEKQELVEKYRINYTTFDFLLRNSDVITLHLPYTGSNYHMFSKREFDYMKDGAYFINVSRGELVENIYLKNSLENGKLSGAALDVIACETICENCNRLSDELKITSLDCLKNSETVKELISMPNVIITPHMAYESQDAIDYILYVTFENIKNFINGSSENRVF